MKKYLVSGLGISDGGVGRLMRNLIVQGQAEGFITVARRNPQAIRKMLKGRRFLDVTVELILRIWDDIKFSWRVNSISDSIVVFVHPQTAGFSRLFNILKRNKVFLYVMDNSFFCIRSYNLHPALEEECLKCLAGPHNALPECQPFPVKMSKERNLDYLDALASVAHNLTFLAQNDSQAELIRARFGSTTKIKIVGLDTGEVVRDDPLEKAPLTDVATKYDIVFHGAPQLAKGLRYFIELAEALQEFSAFIPSSRDVCERAINRPVVAKNITFCDCSWETGLKSAIVNCRLVINPSLWSAPIEGALQKSIFFAKKVATVESQFGYEKEFAVTENFIRLPRNIAEASTVIRKFMSLPLIASHQEGLEQKQQPRFINIFKMVSESEN